MSRINILFILIITVATQSFGQQERQYSQFMYNKLAINPAFAGSMSSTSFSALYRNQWLGFEGSPVTQTISANVPLFDQRVGIGANLIHSTIGISEMWTLSGMYAYRLPLGNGFISGGLEASLRYYGVNYNDGRLYADQDLALDHAVVEDNLSKFVPNVGLGAYYSDQQFFIGMSVPRILSSNIDFTNAVLASREVQHFYLMTGYSLELAEELFLTPQLNLKFAKNSPISADVNVMFDIMQKFNAGVSYRTGGIRSLYGESIDILGGFRIKQRLFLGLAYDIPVGELGRYNNGSMELMLRYQMPDEFGTNVQNPRFF